MPSADLRSTLKAIIQFSLLGFLTVSGTGCGNSPANPAQTQTEPATRLATAIVPATKPTTSSAPSKPSATKPRSVDTETIRFREISASTGIDFTHLSGDSPEKHYPTGNGSGVAMLDFDGDGLLDLYFATTRNFPLDAPTTSKGNRLYRNRGEGRFEDVTEKAGVGYKGFCHGAAVGDVDNNGFPDLYLCNYGANVLYLNRGDGTFRTPASFGAECQSWSNSAAFLDYDNDGWLDLYVSCYGHWKFDEPHEFCGDEAKTVRIFCPPSMIKPARHFLFRNRGDGTFEDTTERAGVLRNDGRGMGVVASDVNRDGFTDIYVANDMCPHFLFINKGDGTFEDVTKTSGAAVTESGHYQGGMGVDIEDLDGDGIPELFVTNFDGEYNTIHQSTDGRYFEDVSAASGIVRDSIPEVGWGCSLADLDNDGLPDMFVVNGHVDDNLADIGRDGVYEQRAKIWRNLGRCRFRLVTNAGPFFKTGHASRGAAFGDLDNDGDIDVAINRMDNHPAVLLNESDPGHWLRLVLTGTRSSKLPIGAAVSVKLDDRVIHRQLKGGGSYASANDSRLLVGIGQAKRVEKVEIRWPSRRLTILENLALDQTHKIVEPETGPTTVEPPAHGVTAK